MAKKKKSKKADKPTKLPREIAGITLPKQLRKEGGKLIDLMKDPAVAGIATAGLAALTAAIQQKPEKAKSEPKSNFGEGAALIGTMIAARIVENMKTKS